MEREETDVGQNQVPGEYNPHRKSKGNGANGGRDPSGNVLDLVDASTQRQDDLREADSRHFREVLKLHETYGERLRTAESDRIDAIRSVDQGAVTQAATTAEMRANTLAATVATSAEALRTQVQDAAAAAAIALAAALSPIQLDVSELRKAQYQTQGEKTQVVESRDKGLSVAQWFLVALAAAALMVSMVMIVVTVAAIATHGFTQ